MEKSLYKGLNQQYYIKSTSDIEKLNFTLLCSDSHWFYEIDSVQIPSLKSLTVYFYKLTDLFHLLQVMINLEELKLCP